ncbi:MAG: phosphoribosylanthranilate isomerase [Cyclobacteriaceae bacterium]|nr:phosphoribosylanthranilate isomerase [Cyclobacteriaceae bacterium]
MKYQDNIRDVLDLEPDYMGFICYAGSSRYVGDNWKGIPQDFPESTKKVGVFVNESMDQLMSKWLKFPFDLWQLHGNETPDYCRELSEMGKVVIKAFPVETAADLKGWEAYKPWVQYFLLDTKTPGYGGSGRAFDWKILNDYDNDIPMILSGGISLEMVPQLSRLSNLNLAFIDVNSRFEREPGFKNVAKLSELKRKLDTI